MWDITVTNLTTPTSTTLTTFMISDTAERSVGRLWGSLSPEELRREEQRRELEKLLEQLATRRARHQELVRALALSERRPRPRTAREPEQRPKARSTSGSERWRVRNPNV